jgi:hypothetical protein
VKNVVKLQRGQQGTVWLRLPEHFMRVLRWMDGDLVRLEIHGDRMEIHTCEVIPKSRA